MFKDRIEAGKLLAEKLKKFKHDRGVVLAIPRGGVPVAYAVARELNFPIEIVFTKKIGHPINKEFAIGAASLTDYYVEPHKGVTRQYVEKEVADIRKRLREMYQQYMDGREPENLEGKTVIIIDDGIATGSTLLSTVQIIKKSRPGKIIIAAPVAPKAAVKKLSEEVDEVIVLLKPTIFYGVGAFYEEFLQVTDAEVMYYLDQLRELFHAKN